MRFDLNTPGNRSLPRKRVVFCLSRRRRRRHVSASRHPHHQDHLNYDGDFNLFNLHLRSRISRTARKSMPFQLDTTSFPPLSLFVPPKTTGPSKQRHPLSTAEAQHQGLNSWSPVDMYSSPWQRPRVFVDDLNHPNNRDER